MNQRVSEAANPLSDGDIATTNVLPAYRTSLAFGATEAALESALGWRKAHLEAPDAHVTGASTYAHFELMHTKPRFAEFVVAAAAAHTLASLGIVGLACKTAATVGDAMASHQRYQQLTNRSASYRSVIDGPRIALSEHRPGPARLGKELVSEYAMLVAVRLVTLITGMQPNVIALHTRRKVLPPEERAHYEAFLGAPILTAAATTALIFERTLLDAPTARPDAELEAHFLSVLHRSLERTTDEPAQLAAVRSAMRAALFRGTPTTTTIGKSLGLGARTLQRRLAREGVTFAELLDDTRRTLAEEHLRTTLSLAEVAWLLGYQEQASFFRAFRRWHGTTPDAYRRAGAR